MKLGIVIPHYNEESYIIKPLLDMLSLQFIENSNDSYSVTIVNDGNDNLLTDSFLFEYRLKYNINYIVEEHKGVSHSRNIGIDKTDADYLLFIDCDDLLYSIDSLNIIFNDYRNNPDKDIYEYCIFTNYMNEVRVDHTTNQIHAKVFKKQFLLDNQIRFSEKLFIHEDRIFSRLCFGLTDNTFKSDKPIVYFRDRKTSMTHRVPMYEYYYYPELILANMIMINEFLRLKRYFDVITYSYIQIIDFYVRRNFKPFQVLPDKLKQSNDIFKIFYKSYKKFADKCDNVGKETVERVLCKQFKIDKIDHKDLDNWLSQFEN